MIRAPIRDVAIAALIAAATTPCAIRAQEAGHTFDTTIAPGANYDVAQFRLWYPDHVSAVHGVLILVPGSNEDGRPLADDSVWRAFAIQHQLALVGCYLTDHPHPQEFIEEYAAAAGGSGQALLDVLTALARRTGHQELADAPLLLWGMSAGGEFNYEFVAWKPERVLAFVVNKGGIYYTALMSRAARAVPGLLFIGADDIAFRTQTIRGLFAVNRRAGALWALVEEPGVAHQVGRSDALSRRFFADVLPLRLAPARGDDASTNRLAPLAARSGFIGDLQTKQVRAVDDGAPPTVPTAWLPTARVAQAWRAVVTGTPFETP